MDDADLLTQIHTLIAAPGGDAAKLAQMEEVLTVGYARALALEGERWRLERRIADVASQLAGGEGSAVADDLAVLARQMSDADVEVLRLRTALASLRDRASEARSAA